MDVLRFPGTYADASGQEAIVWWVEEARRAKVPGLEFFTTVRGADLQGPDFDALKPATAADAQLPLNRAGDLTECLLSGDLPCTVEVGRDHRPATASFSLDLRHNSEWGPAHRHALPPRREGSVPRGQVEARVLERARHRRGP